MQTLWMVGLWIFFTCKTNALENGIYITSMLPVPRDLKLLLDSMYDDGYTAEYLIKYDRSKDDNSQTDFISGWESQNRNTPNDFSGAIVDPDRDGVRNIPPWMNFTKAVFIPNEIDYKIRARHKFHPHSGRIGGTLQKQVARYNDDEIKSESYGSNENQEAKLSSHSNKINSNTEKVKYNTLDFLLPIPGYEEKFISKLKKKTPIFKLQQSIQREQLLPSIINKCFPENKISQVNIHQNPKRGLISTSSDCYQAQVFPESITPSSSLPNSTSGFSLVELLKKTFKYKKRDNETDSKNGCEGSLDSLHSKLINMKTLEENNPKSFEEKDYLSSLNGKKSEDMKQTKRLRQLRPAVIRSKIMHPGHRVTYRQHFGPFNF